MPHLEIDGKSHELTSKEVILGRSSICDIILGDADTSRRHAKAWVEDGHGWIEDLGTQNGTKVNDVRITTKCRLVPGDTIRIGQHRLSYIGDPVPMSEAATMMSPPTRPPILEQTFHPDSAARSSGTNMSAPSPHAGATPATGHQLGNDTWAPPQQTRSGVPGWVVVVVALMSAGISGTLVWYL
jgi:hypothetical protein